MKNFVNSLSVRQHLQTNAFVYICAPGLAVNAIVRISAAGTVAEAQSNVPTNMPAIGLVISKPTTTSAVVVTRGRIGGFIGLTPGDPVFVSATVPGGVQSTAGPVSQQIGVASSPTEILLDVGFGGGGGSGGGSTTGPTLSKVPFTVQVPGITQPNPGLAGTDIDTLDHLHLIQTAQKFEWIVPDDIALGSVEIVAIYGMSTAVGGPNNFVRLRSKVSIADVVGGSIDEASFPNLDSTITTPVVAIGTAAGIVVQTIRTLPAGTVVAGDALEVTVHRLGNDGADLHTGAWKVIGYAVRYTAQIQTRSFCQFGDIFQDTSAMAPTPGVLGTDVDTLDFPQATDTEQKIAFIVPDSWDGSSDAQLRLDYAIGASVTGTVRIETAGQNANDFAGTVDTFPVVDFDLVFGVAPTANAPARTVVVRSIPGTSLHKGDHLTIRIKRFTGVGGNIAAAFRLINATLTLGQTGSAGVTQALIEEKYLSAVVFGNVSGAGVSSDATFPNFATDFERLVTFTSTVAAGRIDGAFEGRLALTQTLIDSIKISVKGSGGTPQYRLKVFAEGSGNVPVYDSGLTAAPGAITELTVLAGALSAQPTSPGGRFFVVVEAHGNIGDSVFYSYPFVKQE